MKNLNILFKASLWVFAIVFLTYCKSPQTYKGTPPPNKPLPCPDGKC